MRRDMFAISWLIAFLIWLIVTYYQVYLREARLRISNMHKTSAMCDEFILAHSIL